MPRAQSIPVSQIGASQAPPSHRTNPYQNISQRGGFAPAARVGVSAPPNNYEGQDVEIVDNTEEGEQEQRQTRGRSQRPSQRAQQQNTMPSSQRASQVPTQGPLTKQGYPDRRFKGQRDLPPPPEQETERRARVGGFIGDMAVTIDGKPDRRFKANRGLSDEELMAKWVQEMSARFGQGNGGGGGRQR